MSSAFPLEVEPPREVRRMNRAERERYLGLWDAGDEHDEQELDPTRPLDSDLLPK